jgi:hypothetical protein
LARRSHLRMLPQSLLQSLLSAYHMNLQLVILCLRLARRHAHLRGLATAIHKISGLTSPDNIYGYCHNSGQGQQEKAIGEIQEHEVTYTKTKAVNSGSAEGPIDA